MSLIPGDQDPISVVSWEHSLSFMSFQGSLQDNDTQRLGLDFQRMIRIHHMLYIAARDHVFAVNLTTAAENFVPQTSLTWKSKDVGKCTVRGKNSDECYNYIKVLVPKDDETLFTCGTNAFNPTCRSYQMSTLKQVGEDVLGQARCPFESGQSNVGIFAGGDFYSATMTDFLASDAVIYRSLGEGRPVLRTIKYDSKWLREPHFLHAIDFGNYVYFFFREISVEYTALGKVVFSRVGRVCKNDNGGSPRVLDRHWSSFLKARLNCSIPGDSFFYFDVLQSITNVLQINGRPAVVGVFTTQTNSIPGSAVCAFYMDDIENVFNGKFKEQKNSDSSWTPVAENQVPKPRPGSCAGDPPAEDYSSSVQFPDQVLTFSKTFPLMDLSVTSILHRPLFTRTTSRPKLSSLAVDVSAGPHWDQMVLFLGSDDGKVLKVLLKSTNQTYSPVLLEEIPVYNPLRCGVRGQEDRTVLSLELDRENRGVFVAFKSCVIRVALSRCELHYTCRRSCLASQDPYCIWLRTGRCENFSPGFKAGFEQDLDGDSSFYTDSCHGSIMATTRNHDSDAAYGVGSLSDSHVHYTLLIACVFVAFSLGAILSGFTVSCYCRGPTHQATPLAKDPEASLPHTLSLRSLAKLNGLLDHSSKEKLDVSRLYSSFVNGAEPPLNCVQSQELPVEAAPELSLSQTQTPAEEGFESSLPTPEHSPETRGESRSDSRSESGPDRSGTPDHNQNPTTDSSCPDSALTWTGSVPSCTSVPGFVAFVGHSSPFQSPAVKSDSFLSTTVGTAQFSDSDRRTTNQEPVSTGSSAYLHQSQPSLPQVDVSALDELLRHIHEVSASGTGGIKVLTSTSSSSLFPLHPNHPHLQSSHLQKTQQIQQQNNSTTTRTHHYTPQPLPKPAQETGTFLVPKLLEPPRGSTSKPRPCEKSGSHAPRHLVKMGARNPTLNSLHPTGFLGHMNTNSSNNGPPRVDVARENLNTSDIRHANTRPTVSLTRQHSYSEGPRSQRVTLRRSVSLKPQIPPKPLFLPNAATLTESLTETAERYEK